MDDPEDQRDKCDKCDKPHTLTVFPNGDELYISAPCKEGKSHGTLQKRSAIGQDGKMEDARLYGDWCFATSYRGEFKHGVPEGYGEIVMGYGSTRDQDRYYGWFVGGKRHGYGWAWNDSDDQEYCGQWVNGKREGRGTWKYYGSNQRYSYTFVGEWLDDKREGRGITVRRSDGHMPLVSMATWSNGEMVGCEVRVRTQMRGNCYTTCAKLERVAQRLHWWQCPSCKRVEFGKQLWQDDAPDADRQNDPCDLPHDEHDPESFLFEPVNGLPLNW